MTGSCNNYTKQVAIQLSIIPIKQLDGSAKSIQLNPPQNLHMDDWNKPFKQEYLEVE